jgi:hypothetical protein
MILKDLVQIATNLERVIVLNSIETLSAVALSRSGTTSEYVLNPNELNNLRNQIYTDHNVQITNDLAKIKTQFINNGHSYTAIFDIPVEDDSRKVDIYKISSLPSFTHKALIQPIVTFPYIAVNKQTKTYTELSEDKVIECLTKHRCTVHNPFRTLTYENCDIRTLFNQPISDRCPITVHPITGNFFYSAQTAVIFSVKEKTEVTISCSDPGHSFPTVRTLVIKDRGHFAMNWKCSAATPEGEIIISSNLIGDQPLTIRDLSLRIKPHKSQPIQIDEDPFIKEMIARPFVIKELDSLLAKQGNRTWIDTTPEILEEFTPQATTTSVWSIVVIIVTVGFMLMIFCACIACAHKLRSLMSNNQNPIITLLAPSQAKEKNP